MRKALNTILLASAKCFQRETMELVQINQKYPDEHHVALLFCLLSERELYQNISHKQMPHYLGHESFIRSEPYLVWYLIKVTNTTDTQIVGAIYLTRLREIGISIFKKHRGNKYGSQAVQMLMDKYKGKFLANIAPGNLGSIAMFKHLGFKKIQATYLHE